MKKLKIILLLLFSFILVSCSNKPGDNNEEEKLNIVTSFFPPYDLAKNVGKEKINLYNLTQTGNAHSFEPSIKDMEYIYNADLLIINGAGFEGWIDKIVESQGDLKILDLSKDFDLITVSDNKEYDPHTWLDPSLYIKMLEKVKDKLIELDEKNKDYYLENYNLYLNKLNELNDEYDSKLSKFSNKSFVTPHIAFNYMVNKYNIKQIGIEGINSVSEPNASRVSEIVEQMKKENIKTVFYEYKNSDKIAKSISNEIDGKVKPISTLEVISKEDIDNGDDYISLMKMNLYNLVDSFEGR